MGRIGSGKGKDGDIIQNPVSDSGVLVVGVLVVIVSSSSHPVSRDTAA